ALSWVFLIAPAAHDDSLRLGAKLMAVAYPVLDLVLLAGVARLAIAPGQRRMPSFALLLIGFAVLLGADSVQRWLQLHGRDGAGQVLDVGWIAFCALV